MMNDDSNRTQRILFQGDSITDCGRDRSLPSGHHPAALGHGYALLLASRLLCEQPSVSVLNRGISGHRVPDLLERWQRDTIELEPTLLSILIGVNDIWHSLQGRYGGSVQGFEQGYRELMQRTREGLPNVQLVLCEPFVVRCGAVTGDWFPEFDARRAVVRRLASDFEARFVPFQSTLDEACERAPAEHWAADGVHPTPAGHYLLAEAWYQAVQEVG